MYVIPVTTTRRRGKITEFSSSAPTVHTVQVLKALTVTRWLEQPFIARCEAVHHKGNGTILSPIGQFWRKAELIAVNRSTAGCQSSELHHSNTSVFLYTE